jgi:hypothetical protein
MVMNDELRTWTEEVNVKLSLCLTKHRAMKIYWGSGGIAPHILISVLDRGEWSVSLPGHFSPREKNTLVPIGKEAGRAPEAVL